MRTRFLTGVGDDLVRAGTGIAPCPSVGSHRELHVGTDFVLHWY